MSTFDAYHRWLGIPPDQQPPDHYRLLGVERFESDPAVIEAAADRQMLFIKTHAAGKHSKLTQKLLNEISAAKICLLKPKKKADYDRQLKAQIPALENSKLEEAKPDPLAPAPPGLQVTRIVQAPPSAEAPPRSPSRSPPISRPREVSQPQPQESADTGFVPSMRPSRWRFRRKSSLWLHPAVITGVISALVALTLIVMMSKRNRPAEAVEDPNSRDDKSRVKTPVKKSVSPAKRKKIATSAKLVDLLSEYEKRNKWKDLLSRGSWSKQVASYRIVPTSGNGADFGWAYSLAGANSFVIKMVFRMSPHGAIQVVLRERPQIPSGVGVLIAYETTWWKNGFSVGDLSRREKDAKTTRLLPLGAGWHSLIIDVQPGKISAKLDGQRSLSWEGKVSPICICISGDEVKSWHIRSLTVALPLVQLD